VGGGRVGFAGMGLPLVLGSGSPRRSELLARAGIAFEVRPADIDETAEIGEAPAAFALRLARAKAIAVATLVGASPRRIVLGADTIVVVDGDVLGKPTIARTRCACSVAWSVASTAC